MVPFKCAQVGCLNYNRSWNLTPASSPEDTFAYLGHTIGFNIMSAFDTLKINDCLLQKHRALRDMNWSHPVDSTLQQCWVTSFSFALKETNILEHFKSGLEKYFSRLLKNFLQTYWLLFHLLQSSFSDSCLKMSLNTEMKVTSLRIKKKLSKDLVRDSERWFYSSSKLHQKLSMDELLSRSHFRAKKRRKG